MSFVLNREAKLDDKCESPKLWRPGRLETEQNQSVLPADPAACGRGKEDLYKYYETMTLSASPADLSLKDLVQRTQSRNSPRRISLDKIQESKAHDGRPLVGDDRLGTFKRWNQNAIREERPLSPKVIVPSKANGDHVINSPRQSFGEYFEGKQGDGVESLQNHPGNKIPETWTPHSGRFPGVTPVSRAAVVKPTPRNHNSSSSPLRSPLRSRSPLAAVHHQQRASQLASGSSPARIIYGTDGDSIDWTNPAASPRHWGNTKFAPSGLAREYYAKEHAREQYHALQKEKHQHLVSSDQKGPKGPKVRLGDEVKLERNTAPASEKAQTGNRCSSCSSYTLLKRTRCVVCGKIYCRNCVKENMRNRPEGRKCNSTCLDKPVDKSPNSKDSSEERSHRCWPFAFPKGAKKSESNPAMREIISQNQFQPGSKTNRTPSRESISPTNGNAS